jgi:hypothetical protein
MATARGDRMVGAIVVVVTMFTMSVAGSRTVSFAERGLL